MQDREVRLRRKWETREIRFNVLIVLLLLFPPREHRGRWKRVYRRLMHHGRTRAA